jgi:hypothetical protein
MRRHFGALPWASPDDARAAGDTEYLKDWLLPFGKNVLSWRPRDGADSLVVVVGDSYADDVDMGFETWPSELSRLLGSTCVCTATGGTRSSHVCDQLARAHAFLDVDGRGASFPPSKRWLVVHTGGNDVLAALLFPPLLLLLWFDLIHLSLSAGLGWLLPPTRPLRWSFLNIVSSYSARHLTELLRDAAARGHTRVLVARPPFSPSVPLARALGRLLLFGLPTRNALTDMLALAFRLFRIATDEAVARFGAAQPGMRVIIFDEPGLLSRMAIEHGAASFGLWHVPWLIRRRFRRNFTLWRGASPGPTINGASLSAQGKRSLRRESGTEKGGVGGGVNGGSGDDATGDSAAGGEAGGGPVGAAGRGPGGAASGGAAKFDFWHDAHHPGHDVHVALARHAAVSLAGCRSGKSRAR